MSPDPQARVGAAVRSLADAVHVDPPDLAVLMSQATRRPSRWRPLLSAAGVLGVLAAAALGPGLLAQPAAPTDGTVLPTRLAGLSVLTAAVSEAPAGPALLAYVQGINGLRWLHTLQTVVLSTDGHTYRRLDEAERRGGPAELGTWQDAPVLLAPDGTRVAVGSAGSATDVAVVDLRTGRTGRYEAGTAGVVHPLAWSPDGTRLAYTIGDTESAVLDLTTGASTRLAALATAAAFSPDGRRLAVQGSPETEVEPLRAIRIVDLAGGAAVDLTPAGFGVLIAGSGAWSPDGRWLALADNAGVGKLDCTITFLPTDPADRTPPPSPIATADQIALVGWLGPDRPLVTQGGATDHRTILDPAAARTLTTVEDSSTYDLQAATALLPTARPAPPEDPARGPWPAWLSLVTAAVALTAAGLTWLLWSRRRA